MNLTIDNGETFSPDLCKNGEAGCGTYYDCGKCTDELRRRIWSKMTPERKAYDNFVDPLGAYHTDYDKEKCCSCHINPPCSFCVDENRDE